MFWGFFYLPYTFIVDVQISVRYNKSTEKRTKWRCFYVSG